MNSRSDKREIEFLIQKIQDLIAKDGGKKAAAILTEILNKDIPEKKILKKR